MADSLRRNRCGIHCGHMKHLNGIVSRRHWVGPSKVVVVSRFECGFVAAPIVNSNPRMIARQADTDGIPRQALRALRDVWIDLSGYDLVASATDWLRSNSYSRPGPSKKALKLLRTVSEFWICVLKDVWASRALMTAFVSPRSRSGELANCSFRLLLAC